MRLLRSEAPPPIFFIAFISFSSAFSLYRFNLCLHFTMGFNFIFPFLSIVYIIISSFFQFVQKIVNNYHIFIAFLQYIVYYETMVW